MPFKDATSDSHQDVIVKKDETLSEFKARLQKDYKTEDGEPVTYELLLKTPDVFEKLSKTPEYVAMMANETADTGVDGATKDADASKDVEKGKAELKKDKGNTESQKSVDDALKALGAVKPVVPVTETPDPEKFEEGDKTNESANLGDTALTAPSGSDLSFRIETFAYTQPVKVTPGNGFFLADDHPDKDLIVPSKTYPSLDLLTPYERHIRRLIAQVVVAGDATGELTYTDLITDQTGFSAHNPSQKSVLAGGFNRAASPLIAKLGPTRDTLSLSLTTLPIDRIYNVIMSKTRRAAMDVRKTAANRFYFDGGQRTTLVESLSDPSAEFRKSYYNPLVLGLTVVKPTLDAINSYDKIELHRHLLRSLDGKNYLAPFGRIARHGILGAAIRSNSLAQATALAGEIGVSSVTLATLSGQHFFGSTLGNALSATSAQRGATALCAYCMGGSSKEYEIDQTPFSSLASKKAAEAASGMMAAAWLICVPRETFSEVTVRYLLKLFWTPFCGESVATDYATSLTVDAAQTNVLLPEPFAPAGDKKVITRMNNLLFKASRREFATMDENDRVLTGPLEDGRPLHFLERGLKFRLPFHMNEETRKLLSLRYFTGVDVSNPNATDKLWFSSATKDIIGLRDEWTKYAKAALAVAISSRIPAANTAFEEFLSAGALPVSYSAAVLNFVCCRAGFTDTLIPPYPRDSSPATGRMTIYLPDMLSLLIYGVEVSGDYDTRFAGMPTLPKPSLLPLAYEFENIVAYYLYKNLSNRYRMRITEMQPYLEEIFLRIFTKLLPDGGARMRWYFQQMVHYPNDRAKWSIACIDPVTRVTALSTNSDLLTIVDQCSMIANQGVYTFFKPVQGHFLRGNNGTMHVGGLIIYGEHDGGFRFDEDGGPDSTPFMDDRSDEDAIAVITSGNAGFETEGKFIAIRHLLQIPLPNLAGAGDAILGATVADRSKKTFTDDELRGYGIGVNARFNCNFIGIQIIPPDDVGIPVALTSFSGSSPPASALQAEFRTSKDESVFTMPSVPVFYRPISEVTKDGVNIVQDDFSSRVYTIPRGRFLAKRLIKMDGAVTTLGCMPTLGGILYKTVDGKIDTEIVAMSKRKGESIGSIDRISYGEVHK